MKTFLQTVAEIIRQRHPENLDQVTLVLNNRRPIRFLKKELIRLYGDKFFLPQIIVIDDLISSLSNLNIIPNELLLFELYTIHKEIGVRKDETFEAFMPTAEMMISDFSEIDLYNIDAKKIFSNLKETKAIEQWNVSGEPLTQMQRDYLQFFESLHTYYNLLRERLKTGHQAYGGMAYREVAEKIEQLIEKHSKKSTYFIGFQSLSRCEEIIIEAYLKRGYGHFISDGDQYYYGDTAESEIQEAGDFLRKYHKKYNNLIKTFDAHFRDLEKHIHIVSCPENIVQAKYAGNLLKQLQEQGKSLENTALILADESLVIPVLNSIPSNIETLNVTMGIPFTESNIYLLSSKYFDLHIHLNKGKYRHQEILHFITDQHIQNILGNNTLENTFHRKTQQDKIIFMSSEELYRLAEETGLPIEPLRFAFEPSAHTPRGYLLALQKIMTLIEETGAINNNEKELLAMDHMSTLVNHLLDITERYPHIETLSTLQKIFHRIARRYSMPFIGEALEGLQLLGILEARNIDFERLVILSANEKIIPAGRSHNSLIPYSIKKIFNIPTHHDKDAVAAYRFYRMIQRSSEVYLLYNSETEGAGKGEPSRFIKQICDEMTPQAGYLNTHIYKETVSLGISSLTQEEHKPIEKDEEIMRRLKEIAQKGFSASSLNCYRGCPLKFYYERVLSLKEEEEAEDALQNNELGTLIHTVMEKIFNNETCKSKPITPEYIEQSLSKVSDMVDSAFEEQFGKNRNRIGKNSLLLEVAKSQISEYLIKEKERVVNHQIVIQSCEQELAHTFLSNPEEATIRFHGIADRIDSCDGVVRILDYKTGKLEATELAMDDTKFGERRIKDKWFQVMYYAWLYQRTHNDSRPLTAGIVPLSKLKSDIALAQWDMSEIIDSEHLTSFETYLKEVVSDIMNPEIPFDNRYKMKDAPCSYCDFASMCGQVSDKE